MRRSEYLSFLQEAILATHGVKATHESQSYVKALFEDQVAWEGEVEVFNIAHPEAEKCYAWAFEDGKQFRAVCVLGKHPVTSPSIAVDVHIAAKAEELRRREI